MKRSFGYSALVLSLVVAGCSSTSGDEEARGSSSAALSESDLASLALASEGGRACGTNTLGGQDFESSCTGNGGQPEYWCADFVKWIWRNRGADVGGLTAASGSFYVYGQNHGTLSNTPTVGAAIVFDYHGGGSADHVAIVTAVHPDGRIETASGDWNGQNGSEAFFSSTSRVVVNRPAYSPAVGTSPAIIGMTISGFIRPVAVGGGGGGGGGGAAPPPNGCTVHGDDHKLYCANTANAALHAQPTNGSAVVNHLATTYSWFDCWETGDLHAGGNTTWYHTVGDDNPSSGWAPAVDLQTPNAFDANPSASGLQRCGGAPPPPPPPPPTNPSCSVHADGRLYCMNALSSVIRATPSNGAAVVDTLRTTDSWFDCWTTGELHAGGNTTWYHTEGDDYGSWGFVPGVDLETSNGFDANPSGQGLKHCL